jgi:hypothetical protein
MTWKTIRLELARTDRFPKGSASRAYILRVPLDNDGLINAEVLERNPSRATARRFWSSEPDRFGRVEHSDGYWLLRCRDAQGETDFRMSALPLILDNEIIIEEPDGSKNPFRVASIQSSDPVVAAAS